MRSVLVQADSAYSVCSASYYYIGFSGAKLAYTIATRALRAVVEHVLALMSAADTVVTR